MPKHLLPKGRVLVENASEICIPEAQGTGVTRHVGWGLLLEGGVVRWVGPLGEAPLEAGSAAVFDAEGRAVLPALVDSHTHLVHAGDRVDDFCRRARGESYTEIAATGGGIQTTVHATRLATKEQLKELARSSLERRAAHGIATTEVKSGYGLSTEEELRILEVIFELSEEGYDLEATFLGAHAVPTETNRSDYVRSIVEEMIPDVAARGLARFIDVFVEEGAFSVDEARKIFRAGLAHGLIPRVHADQLTPSGGALLAAEVHAASADHLEHISPEGMAALAAAGVVANLLPGAMLYLGDQARGLGRRLIDAGVEIALSTDTNPGSSPTHNLPLVATLAVTQLGLEVEEALRAVTLGGAHALRRRDIGSLTVGQRARFIVLESRDSRALVAAFGEPIVRALVLQPRA